MLYVLSSALSLVTGRTLACEKPALIVLNPAQLGVTLLLYD